MEPGIGKDIAILFLGSAIGTAPWLLDKAGRKLPRIAIALGGWVAVAASSWGTAKLLSLAVPERTVSISLPGIVLLCIAIFVGTLWSFAILRPARGERRDSVIEAENRDLKAQLAKKASFVGPVHPAGYFYKETDMQHPLCPRCLQEKGHEYLLPEPERWSYGGIRRRCNVCGWFGYETPPDRSGRP